MILIHMSHQTVIVSSFEEYLANTDETEEELAEKIAIRNNTLCEFPLAWSFRSRIRKWTTRIDGCGINSGHATESVSMFDVG